MENINEKISLKEKFGFMSFSAASNIIFNFKGSFFLIYINLVLGIPVDIAGIILAIGTIWDAINDPIIATICANVKFKSGEKLRPYILWFCVPFAVTTLLLFTNFNLPTMTLKIIYVAVLYFVFETMFTFFNLPYLSMASLSTNNESDRISINSFRGLGSCIGSIVGTAAIVPMIKLFGGYKFDTKLTSADSMPMFWTVLVLGVLVIIGSAFHYKSTKERIKDTGENEEHISIFKAYKILFRCKSWILNLLFLMGYSMTTALLMNNIQYYATFNLQDQSKGTFLLAFYIVAAILISVFIPFLEKKLSRKWAMLLPLLFMFVGKIPFCVYPNLITCCINAFTSGVGVTATFIILNANRNTVSDILEVQNGRRIDPLVSGCDALIDKCSQALTIFAFTQVLKNIGFDDTLLEQPAIALTGIQSLIGWVPQIVCALLILVAIFLNPAKELKKEKEKKSMQ